MWRKPELPCSAGVEYCEHLDLFGQRLSSSGANVWGSSGLRLTSGVHNPANDPIRAVTDGADGAIVLFRAAPSELPESDEYMDLMTLRVDASGRLGAPEPRNVTVTDVPSDQGGSVDVHWHASALERLQPARIQSYRVWRGSAPGSGEMVAVRSATNSCRMSARVATSQDSISGGPSAGALYWVEAYGQGGAESWSEGPIWGVSMDDLSPAPPSTLAAKQSPASVQWTRSTASDLAGYELHAGPVPDFIPTPASLLRFTTDSTAAVSVTNAFLKLCSVDTHGNRSPYLMCATPLEDIVQYVPPTELAELDAGRWRLWAADGELRAFDDFTVKRSGASSLRLEATGGFDNSWSYPGDQPARWDLRATDSVLVWFRAENPNPFQNASPWIFLRSALGSVQLHPDEDVLNSAIGAWVQFRIPLTGNAQWARSVEGVPDLSRITSLEVHADTWDYGFKLWMDGVRFVPPPPTPTASVPAEAVVQPSIHVTSGNPSRSEVRFAIAVPIATEVRLDIYDSAGRHTRCVQSRPLMSGAQDLVWDGADASGRVAPSGMYFARLRCGAAEVTVKFVRLP